MVGFNEEQDIVVNLMEVRLAKGLNTLGENSDQLSRPGSQDGKEAGGVTKPKQSFVRDRLEVGIVILGLTPVLTPVLTLKGRD